jgi:hypothetical protein
MTVLSTQQDYDQLLSEIALGKRADGRRIVTTRFARYGGRQTIAVTTDDGELEVYQVGDDVREQVPPR